MIFSLVFFPCDRASELKTAIRSKNQTLKHLNQVLNICFLLTGGSQDKPIRCHGVTEWRRLLREDSLDLTCVLENSSPFAFEQGWTLSVTAFPPSGPPSRGGGNASRSFSFPFHSVQPGETFEVVLPLAAADGASFPMTISCSLVFSFLGLLAEEAAVNLPDSQRSFALPLNTLTVDWLHALQGGGSTATHSGAASQCGDSRTDAVRAFLNSRRIGWEAGGTSASGPEAEQFSASVRLSSELVGSALAWEPRGEKSARRDVCGPLLDWLLAAGCGGVRPGHHRDQVDGSVVRAQCPDGHPVKLSATEVKKTNKKRRTWWKLSLWRFLFEGNKLFSLAGGFGGGGVSDHSGASHGEPIHSGSVWAAPRRPAPCAGNCANTQIRFFSFSLRINKETT